MLDYDMIVHSADNQMSTATRMLVNILKKEHKNFAEVLVLRTILKDSKYFKER
jgi:hypothetical protein